MIKVNCSSYNNYVSANSFYIQIYVHITHIVKYIYMNIHIPLPFQERRKKQGNERGERKTKLSWNKMGYGERNR